MLIHELLPLVGTTTSVVQIGGDETLPGLLRLPEGVVRRTADAGSAEFGPDTLVTAFVGPDPARHVDAGAVAGPLKRLPVGGRAVLLLGWAVPDLPYHLLLDPLVQAGCQVLQVVPLDKVSRHGAHCAVLAARVADLAPWRSHLDDTPVDLTGDAPGPATRLRLVAEYQFGDLVARSARRRLVEHRDRQNGLEKQVRRLEQELAAAQEATAGVQRTLADTRTRLTETRAQLERLRASTAYRFGTTVVRGVRRPTRAVTGVPAGLVRLWRGRDNPPR